MPIAEIEHLLRNAFPDAEIDLVDTAGDEDHYALTVTSEAFRGKSRVAQHQMVYAALKGAMTSTLHALQIKTAIPA